jgi:23S rRNA (uracil1939-C5)-methyltransferase/tRNA (uracil-5-)-methyltransferase
LGVGIGRTNVSNTILLEYQQQQQQQHMNTIHDTSPSARRSNRKAKRRREKKEQAKPDYSTYHDDDRINEDIGNNHNNDDDGNVKDDDSSTNHPEKAASNNDHRSWVIMVPRVIPGELVQVRIYRNHATYSEADLMQVLEPSPHRVGPTSNPTITTTPPSSATPSSSSVTPSSQFNYCPLFDQGCGGCQYQHVTIEQQRLYKQHHVRDALIRIGRLDRDHVHRLVLPTLGTTDHVWQYRTKLTPHYQALSAFDIKMMKNGSNISDDEESSPSSSPQPARLPPIGFQHVNDPRIILDVPTCPIATPAINEQLTLVRQHLHQSLQDHGHWPTKLGATLLLRQGDPNGPVTTQYKDYVTSQVNGLQFRFQAGNFFQNNPYMVPVMVNQVVQAATAPRKYDDNDNNSSSSHDMPHNNDTTTTTTIPTTTTTDKTKDNSEMTHLIDCYCGSGLFAVSCAPHLQRCMGIEVNDQAVLEAKANAQLNQLTNCDFVSASAEHIFDLVQDFPRASTSVLMDPPRKGCSPEFLQQLIDYAPQRIIYVSCDPATQARDLQSLVDRYEITKVQPMDLFPQTRHIECLVVLEAKSNATRQ